MAYARMLAVVTVVYNVIEGLVSMGFGASDESVALFGFGADSFIEVGSALLVLWRLKAVKGCSATRLSRERKATRGIGFLFLLLAVGIAVGSITQLVMHRHPETTLPGVIISLVSLSGMAWLWRSKQAAAKALDSQTLKGDAACSLACIQLSAVLFAGSILFVFWPALWWVDSLAALVLCAFIAKEGVEGTHSFHTYPVIHGFTSEGQAVSLLKVHQNGINTNFGSNGMYRSERLGTYQLVMGKHLTQDFPFGKVSFRVPGLPFWLSRPVVERKYETDEASGQTTWLYRLLNQEDFITRIPGIAASIEWELICHESNILDPFSGINVSVSGWITVRPDTPKSLDWFLEQHGKITTLLGFLVGTPMSMDRIDGYAEDQRQPLSLLLTYGNRRSCELPAQWEFFMPLAMLGAPLEGVLQQWFEIYPAIKNPLDLAYSVFASGRERLWLHLEFLAWMQALEGLQRALPNHVLPAVQSKKRRPALQERLDALASLLPGNLRQRILEGETVPTAWIDTRHYYTHWIEDQRDGVLDNLGMYDASVRAKHLISALFLSLAGVPAESLANAFQGTSRMAQELMARNAASTERRNPGSGAGLLMAVYSSGAPETAQSPDEPAIENGAMPPSAGGEEGI